MKIPEIKIPENLKDKAQDTISKTKSAVESISHLIRLKKNFSGNSKIWMSKILDGVS